MPPLPNSTETYIIFPTNLRAMTIGQSASSYYVRPVRRFSEPTS